MKISIFWKIIFVFLLISVLPLAGFGIFFTITYQEMLDMHMAQPELASHEEMAVFHQDILIKNGLILLLTIILISFFAFFFTRIFFSPLKKLNLEMRKVARGKLDVHFKIKRQDEFGELAQSFNQMLEELKKTQTKLEEAKQVLEIKVQARTKELKELAEGLEEQVKERTQELQAKIAELERFQRLAVGRELKMIELKKEAKKLKNN